MPFPPSHLSTLFGKLKRKALARNCTVHLVVNPDGDAVAAAKILTVS